MLNLGFVEITVILVVALLVLGPTHLPVAARKLGRSLAEFKHAYNDLRREINLDNLDAPPTYQHQPRENSPSESTNSESTNNE